jgi:hypothetical protein
MVRESEGGEDFKTSPLFSREMGQYDVKTVNFQASKKDPSIADIEISAISQFIVACTLRVLRLGMLLRNHSIYAR